jgi:hypothetical protein
MFENIQRGEYLIGKEVKYFRSKWEANFALYLNFLKAQGEIKDWHYESKWFEFPVKHGTTRYLPDFEVMENNGTLTYYEIKGYMTSRAKTQLKRMKQYYPKVKLVLADAAYMKSLNKYRKLLKFY